MREILFRGKRKDTEEWVEGYLHKMDGYGTGYTEYGIQVQVTSTARPWSVLVIPETVGQYTGLTDKNGKKIFEGDIIKQSYYLGKGIYRDIISSVEYGIGYAYSNVYGVCQRFKDGSGEAMLTVFDKYGNVDCEIIGNIHDNPELLKGGN